MQNNFLIIHNGEDLKFIELFPNSLFTGDGPIKLPEDEGDYCLNISSSGSNMFISLNPYDDKQEAITFTEKFNGSSSNNVEDIKQIVHKNIPNGKYLMLVNALIYTDKYRFTIPKYSLSANGDNFYSSYIRDFTSNITSNTIVDISNNSLTIDVSTADCEYYSYCYFKITLIPVN